MSLNREKYTLFTNTDFINIIGRDLNDVLSNEGIGNNGDYLITYVSNLINMFIKSKSGRGLFKVYDEASPNDYKAIWGYTEKTGVMLSERQIEAIKLACVYQTDYIIDNGSSERMSGLSLVGRSGVIPKHQMEEYEICKMSYNLLLNAGLLYAGLTGGDFYARLK